MMHAATFLFVPGDRPDRFAKALASGADRAIIDLEDAVRPEAMAEARQATLAANVEWARVAVRINDATSPHFADDRQFLRACGAVATLAELAGAPVMQGSGRQWNFPTTHPLCIGPLGFMGGMRENLAGYDVIVAIGTGDPFRPLFYEGPSPIPDGCQFIHIDVDTYAMGKDYAISQIGRAHV